MFCFDPVRDPRWLEYLRGHPAATVFHSPAWLQALQRTFRYEAFFATTSHPGEVLRIGIVFCRIGNTLTGRRLVSLPFSDHCEPLSEKPDDLPEMLCAPAHYINSERMSYAEVRPRTPGFPMPVGFAPAGQYWLHTLDLTPGEDELFHCSAAFIETASSARYGAPSGRAW